MQTSKVFVSSLSWWALLAGHVGHGGETLLQQFTAASPTVSGNVPAQVSGMDLSAQFELGDTLNPHWSLATSVRRICELFVWLKTPGATEQIAHISSYFESFLLGQELEEGKETGHQHLIFHDLRRIT